MAVEVGSRAPGFELPADKWDSSVSLEEKLAKGPLVLFFYPGDWSVVCTDQLEVVEDHLPQFEERNAQVMAISVDTPWSHAAFAHSRELTMTLLSDFDRKVTEEYGVLREEGFANRAYFVIDQDGTVLAKHVEDSPGDQTEVEDVISALDRTLLG